MAERLPWLRCIYCHDGLQRGTTVHCASCLAPHHADCQAAHGRCAAPGCDDPRVLVPDPAGRVRAPLPPARGRQAKQAKQALMPRRRRSGLVGLAGGFGLVALGLFSLARKREAEPLAPAYEAEAIAPAHEAESSAPVATTQHERVVHVVPATGVWLVARDFRLPVLLGDQERLVVRAGEQGYTTVVLEAPRRPPETRLVAEPGDAIEVETAPHARLRAAPGEAIVVERAGDDSARVLVVPAPGDPHARPIDSARAVR